MRKWNVRLNGTKVEVLEWSGRTEDEENLRGFCEGQLQYILPESGLAAIGMDPYVTERYAGPGDLIIRHADLTGLPVLRIPGDVEWFRELFGVLQDPELRTTGPNQVLTDGDVSG